MTRPQPTPLQKVTYHGGGFINWEATDEQLDEALVAIDDRIRELSRRGNHHDRQLIRWLEQWSIRIIRAQRVRHPLVCE